MSFIYPVFFSVYYCVSKIVSHICTHIHTYIILPCVQIIHKIHAHIHTCLWLVHIHYSVSESHKHTHCITVWGSYTPIHTYILHYWHTRIYMYLILFCVWFKCTHVHIYKCMYTVLFDPYTQLTHVCIILFCIICIYIHTHFTAYLIYMHILAYWSIHTLKCVIANPVHIQNYIFKCE